MKPMICIEGIADASISYTFDMGGVIRPSRSWNVWNYLFMVKILKPIFRWYYGVNDYEIDKNVNKLSATSYTVCWSLIKIRSNVTNV